MSRLVALLYALVLLGEIVWASLVPLLPGYASQLELTGVQTGALLASASVAILLVSIPSGQLADRIGPRALTVGSAALLAVALVWQALGTSYASLLGSRLLFGLAFGVTWTAGVAWLSASVPDERRTAALAATVTLAGVGQISGPALAGVLVQAFGTAVPFLGAAALALLLTAALAVSPAPQAASEPYQPVGAVLRALRSEPRALGGIALMALGGVVGSVVNLLVPLQLHQNGDSAATIGLAFSAASGLFIASSGVVARLGDRATRLTVGAGATAGLAVALGAAGVATSTAALVSFLVLRAPLTAAVFTISMPLSVSAARRAEIGQGAVMGMLNTTWAAATVIGPLAAGALVESASVGIAWAAAALLSFATASWLLSASRRVEAPASAS